MAYSFEKWLVNPRFGSFLYIGSCPPSKPGRTPPPERAFWPLWPRPGGFAVAAAGASSFTEVVLDGTGSRRKLVKLHNYALPFC